MIYKTLHYLDRLILGVFLLGWGLVGRAQQISLYPSVNSIGYQVALPAGYDADESAILSVQYRPVGLEWEPGFPGTKITIGNASLFSGSIFQLEPDSEYELEICLIDSTPLVQKTCFSEIVHTRAQVEVISGPNVKWVGPNGSGNAYSEANPGDLKTLLASGLPCGTTVFLKGGNYKTGDMSLNLVADCPENEPIVIMAAPGETPVLDGGSYNSYPWFQASGDTNIWWTNLPPNLEFNSLCLVDGERMYPYAFLTPPQPPLDPSYPSLWNLGYDLPGFYRNKSNQVFIKTLDHRNINQSEVIFSEQFTCLTVNGNNKANRLYIKGLKFKYYSKGRCDKDIFGNPTQCYPSGTLILKDVNYAVVEDCDFEFSNFPVSFTGNCNYNTVQNCSIEDGTGYWSHAAFKRTRDELSCLLDPSCGTYGRYLENAGVFFRTSGDQVARGNIVSGNTIEGVVGGIGFDVLDNSRNTECDIHHNRIFHCYDGIDALNTSQNVRIWENEVGYCPVGTSLILPNYGPVFIFRNVYHHLEQRQNYQDDPYFVDCDNAQTHQSWSTALKLNAGEGLPNNAPGTIYFFHNTVHALYPLGFNLYLWAPTWKTLHSRNNIYYAAGKSNFFFDGVSGQPGYHFASTADDVFNAGGGALGIVRPEHGIPHCDAFGDLPGLESGLRSATGSMDVLWKNGLNTDPRFADAPGGDLHLEPCSPLIDKGIAIPGFNNHPAGGGPDIGAFEGVCVSKTSEVTEKDPDLRIAPNPFQDRFQVLFEDKSKEVHLRLLDVGGKLCWSRHFEGLAGKEKHLEADVPELHPGLYFLFIDTPEQVLTAKLIKS